MSRENAEKFEAGSRTLYRLHRALATLKPSRFFPH